jgi:cell division septation protein DedD
MTRGRFGLLLALVALVVAAASFSVALALISDDGDATTQEAGSSTTSSTTSTTTTAPGTLATPAFVVVVSSESEEASAQQLRDELTEGGFDAGVLSSADYSSLEPGFWVAYVGPFPDVAGAEAAKAELVAAGYTASYTRCVGSNEECS